MQNLCCEGEREEEGEVVGVTEWEMMKASTWAQLPARAGASPEAMDSEPALGDRGLSSLTSST